MQAAGLFEFEENARRGLRVEEGDPATSGSDARNFVEELGARSLHLSHGLLDVVDQQTDVVEARALLQKLRDHGRRIRGFEKFEVRLAHRDEGRLHLLGRHLMLGLDLETERFVGALRIAHVFHSDTEVIDLENHLRRTFGENYLMPARASSAAVYGSMARFCTRPRSCRLESRASMRAWTICLTRAST